MRGVISLLTLLGPITLLAAQPTVPANLVTFNDNAAWSWFEGERVIVDRTNNTILLSTVADAAGPGGSARDGNVEVVSYNYITAAKSRFVLSAGLEADDHNSAALYRRPDGRYVASYARHNSDNFTRWRVSTNPGSIANWDAEQTLNNGVGTTYSNILNMSNENGGTGRLYNFTRSVGFDPNILLSRDNGSNWTYGGRLFNGPGRPYVNYAGNGVDRIWLIATDQHPRNFNNSIYAGYIQNGQLFRSDGSVADANILDATAGLPATLTTIFAGNADNIAWTTNIRLDATGKPCLVFTTRLGTKKLPGQDGMDHRFHYARFDGNVWQVNPLACAGSELYRAEADYTGLAALDPHNLNSLYISTNVNPLTNAPLISATDGRRHWEIFHGTTTDGGRTWKWEAVTANSTVDNIRPVMPVWEEGISALLWLRGTYTTYTNYDLAAVGVITLPGQK